MRKQPLTITGPQRSPRWTSYVVGWRNSPLRSSYNDGESTKIQKRKLERGEIGGHTFLCINNWKIRIQ